MPEVLTEVDNWEGRAGGDQSKLLGSFLGCLMPGFLCPCSAETGSQGLVDAETELQHWGLDWVGGT